MFYSTNNLLNNIDIVINGLGLNPKFIENPAYEIILNDIRCLMKNDNVLVNETKGNILIKWNEFVEYSNLKCSLNIYCTNPETINFVKVIEKPFTADDGNEYKEVEVIKNVASLSKLSGLISIITKETCVNNYNCEKDSCNCTTYYEKRTYSDYGIIQERDYKLFKNRISVSDINELDINSMLNEIDIDEYQARTLLIRDKYDTVRIISEDNETGATYTDVAYLNQNSGLRIIVPFGSGEGNYTYPQEVFIPSVAQESKNLQKKKAMFK